MGGVRRRTLALLAAPLLALPACDAVAEEVSNAGQQITDEVVSRGLEQQIKDRLADAGVTLQGDVDCSTGAGGGEGVLSGSVTATCRGRTDDGKDAQADFTGSVSATGGCSGTVVVTVAGREVYRGDAGQVCGGG